MPNFPFGVAASHPNWWLLVLAFILLLGLGGCDRLGNQADRSDSAHQQQLEALSDRLGSLERAIQQQAVGLRQILEQVSRLQSPPEWEDHPKHPEGQAGNLEQWPKDAGEAEQFLKQVSELVQQLEPLSDRLGSLEIAIQQQAAGSGLALRQILEQVSPPQLPRQWENHLKQLEGQAGNVEQWPKDAGEAELFLEQTSELVTEIPAWAEVDYLPRLSLIRWAAMAFTRLNRPQDTNQQLDQIEQLRDEMRELADARPQGGSEALAERLREEAAELAAKAANGRIHEAIEQAQQYLEGNPDTVVSDIATIYEFLRLYEETPDLAGTTANINANIPNLRKKVYEEMARRQAGEQAAVLRTQWSKVSKLAPDQPEYEVAARVLLQRVVSAHVALALEGVATTAYEELESELRSTVETIESNAAERAEELQAQAVRSYQRWALSQIVKFENEFRKISNRAAEAASILRPDDGGWTYYRYVAVQQDMEDYLLPINLTLLDPPVQERYQQAFRTGWNKLDGRTNQTNVAKASARIKKKPLREFLED